MLAMIFDPEMQKKLLALNLESCLDEKEFTQRDFATRIGMSPQQFSFYYLGKRLPSDENLQRMAGGLGIENPWELYRMPNGFASKPQQKAWNAMIDLFSLNEEEDLIKVTDFIEFVIDARKNKVKLSSSEDPLKK